MKIALNVSPTEGKRSTSHRVRGIGFYVENLKKGLLKYYPECEYQFFTDEEELSSDVDIVHYPYFEVFFLTLPKRKNIPTVVTVHDLTPLVFPKSFPPGIKGRIKWLLQKNALKSCDAIIADSEASEKDITKFTKVSPEKIHVVYLAPGEEFKKVVIDQKKKESITKKYNLPDKFVLYVGDATWNKNLPRFIKAVSQISLPLVMVGKALVDENIDKNNPWNQDLLKVRKMAEENKNIIKVGFVPTEDLVYLYNMATVFVMPSLYEGFGLPVLEAMRCGCPVITTNEGSLKEVAGDAAFYVDAYNAENIAKGIKEVFSNISLHKKLSYLGLQQADKFSWKKTASKTMEVYEKTFF